MYISVSVWPLTARQLTQLYLDRIEAFDKDGPAINCIITSIRQRSKKPTSWMRNTGGQGPVGPLHGIPLW